MWSVGNLWLWHGEWQDNSSTTMGESKNSFNRRLQLANHQRDNSLSVARVGEHFPEWNLHFSAKFPAAASSFFPKSSHQSEEEAEETNSPNKLTSIKSQWGTKYINQSVAWNCNNMQWREMHKQNRRASNKQKSERHKNISLKVKLEIVCTRVQQKLQSNLMLRNKSKTERNKHREQIEGKKGRRGKKMRARRVQARRDKHGYLKLLFIRLRRQKLHDIYIHSTSTLPSFLSLSRAVLLPLF